MEPILQKELMQKFGVGYQMIATAELYNQRPKDPIFQRFSAKAMIGIKNLAEAVKKAKEDGKLTDEN